MSGATYRIEIQRNPGSELFPWAAYIIRLSDDKFITSVVGMTIEDAEGSARNRIGAISREDDHTYVLLVDDEGHDVHSVKA